jgi:hypothetical protein
VRRLHRPRSVSAKTARFVIRKIERIVRGLLPIRLAEESEMLGVSS